MRIDTAEIRADGVNDNQPHLGVLAERHFQAAAYSALASFLALIATIIIAFRTYAVSKAIRAGQVAQEQIKMVLEIDSELRRPATTGD